MSRKHGRAKKQKNKLQQLDYLSEDNVVIDFHPPFTQRFVPSLSLPSVPLPTGKTTKTHTGKK